MYCDVDEPAFYSAVDRTARKQHKCCECDAPIERGEKYVVCTGKWENGVETFRQHAACCEACMFMRDKLFDGEECVPFGGMWEEYDELYKAERRAWQKDKRDLFAAILKRERKWKQAQSEPQP